MSEDKPIIEKVKCFFERNCQHKHGFFVFKQSAGEINLSSSSSDVLILNFEPTKSINEFLEFLKDNNIYKGLPPRFRTHWSDKAKNNE